MATRQGIDASILNRLDDDHTFVFFAVKAEFDTSTIAVHTSGGELTLDGVVYEGAGTLLQFSGVTATSELASSGITVGLSGMNATVLSHALTENYQNRPITIHQGFLDAGGSNVTGKMVIFKGRMQNITFTDDPDGTSTVVVQAENRLVDLKRPSNLRYTKESQETVSSGDTGFNRVQTLVDKKIVWGQKEYQSGGSSGGVDPASPDFDPSIPKSER